jgi:hypothetical protein
MTAAHRRVRRPPRIPSNDAFEHGGNKNETRVVLSGWHVLPGVHSVVVLSGSLTVYDEHCVGTEYGRGQTYLGGSTPHVALDESSDALDVAISFVHCSGGGDHGSAVPAPPGCNLP